MSDELFFSDIERQANEARSRHMASRGAHGGTQEEKKIIEVAANPGSGYGVGDKKDGGK